MIQNLTNYATVEQISRDVVSVYEGAGGIIGNYWGGGQLLSSLVNYGNINGNPAGGIIRI